MYGNNTHVIMVDQVQLLCSLQLYLPFLQDIQVVHDGCTMATRENLQQFYMQIVEILV